MILEALRRSLVRYFRPRATSVSPEITEDAIIDRMVERGLIEPVWTRPPPNPAGDQVSRAPAAPSDVDWPTWVRMRQENATPGWIFCRYAIRAAPPSNTLAFPYGIIRGAFGVHAMNFYLGHPINEPRGLHTITHLASGFGCGLFVSLQLAVDAAEIALRISDDWSMFDPDAARGEESKAIVHRLHQAWVGAGITIGPIHAYGIADHATPALNVWIKAETAERPGKLS